MKNISLKNYPNVKTIIVWYNRFYNIIYNECSNLVNCTDQSYFDNHNRYLVTYRVAFNGEQEGTITSGGKFLETNVGAKE